MDLNIKTQYPVKFELIEQAPFEIDNRFRKCKVYICHEGLNLNNSVFPENTLKYMGRYLEGVAIVGFLGTNDLDEEDFRGHEMLLKKVDGKYQFEYLCVPFGCITSSSNAMIEELDLDNSGQTKKWLTCEGILYNRFQKCIDIFERDGLEKSQSMELEETSVKGGFNNNKQFEFTEAKIEFLTILGSDISPAMAGSNVTMFSTNEFKKSFTTMLEEINESLKTFNLNTTNNKGGNEVNREEIITKFSQLKGEEYDSILNNTELTDEELESRLFTLSTNQIRQAINTELDKITVKYQYWDGEIGDIQKYWLADTIQSENLAIVEDNVQWNVFYALPYEINGDVVILDEVNRKRYVRGDWREMVGVETSPINPMYTKLQEMYQIKANEKIEEVKNSFNAKETEEYKALETEFNTKVEELGVINETIETFTAKITGLEGENETLKQFQYTKLKEEKVNKVNEVIAKFSIEGIDIEGIKVEALEEKITTEQLEEKLFALVGKKHFAEQSAKEPIVEPIVNPLTFSLKTTETCPYPSLSQFFQ